MKIQLLLFLLILNATHGRQTSMNTITKSGMTVSWELRDGRIYFEVSAPTDGWVAIGFNDTENIAGNYLIMGQVVNNQVNIEEHYTIRAGHYKPFRQLNTQASVRVQGGSETGMTTQLAFSLPQTSASPFAKDLKEGLAYVLLMAYSQEDDFQHHSIMRTSHRVIL